jgi:hypothetical protein
MVGQEARVDEAGGEVAIGPVTLSSLGGVSAEIRTWHGDMKAREPTWL